MNKIAKLLFLSGVLAFGLKADALAYQIVDLKDIPALGDFVVGPTKHEVFLNPGETAKVELYVMNRLGRAMAFQINVEDFTGSYDTEQTIVLLGDQKGPYSLRDYLKPELTEFVLSHGQKAYFQVEISIPADAESGGRYGAILVSTNPEAVSPDAEPGRAGTAVNVKTRIGSLFFVTVRGEIEQNGQLKNFQIGASGRKFFEKGPSDFKILFENGGNTHLVPYGVITVTNMFGKSVGELEVDPYFSMPKSLRARNIAWDAPSFLFGKYTAALKLNRGYDNVVDTAGLTFWVIPWKVLLVIFVLVVLLVLVLRWIGGKFEIRVKKDAKT